MIDPVAAEPEPRLGGRSGLCGRDDRRCSGTCGQLMALPSQLAWYSTLERTAALLIRVRVKMTTKRTTPMALATPNAPCDHAALVHLPGRHGGGVVRAAACDQQLPAEALQARRSRSGSGSGGPAG